MLKSLTEKLHLIRNVALLAHIDHGKSTLTEALIESNLYEDENQNENDMHTRNEEEIASVLFKLPKVDCPDFLINLFCPPSNVDSTHEFTLSLRASDGNFDIS